MRPCTYVVTKASNDGTFQVGDRIEQLHNGKTWIQNRNIIVEAKESIEGSYGMSFVSEDEFLAVEEDSTIKRGKDPRVDLALDVFYKLLDNHSLIYTVIETKNVDLHDFLTEQSFAIADAMISRIESLQGG